MKDEFISNNNNQTQSQIKQNKQNPNKQKYEKLPNFYKLTLFHQQSLSNVHNRSFYIKKTSFYSIYNLARSHLEQSQFDIASTLFSKALAIFTYIKPSNNESNIKDNELIYIEDNGNNQTEKNEIIKMKISSLLNISLCEYYLQNWTEVRSACDYILKLDKRNIKAYYRKARSYIDCPSSLMDDYLKARDLLETAYNIDNNNNDIKNTLDKLYKYIKQEKEIEKNKYKSFYANVNEKMIKQLEEKEQRESKETIKQNSTDPNNPYNGKTQLQMLETIIEKCSEQIRNYEKSNNNKGLALMKNNIDQAKIYRTNLEMLMNENLNEPSQKMKKFANEEGLDFNCPEIIMELYKLKKKYIDEINIFYQHNLLLMDNINKKDEQIEEESNNKNNKKDDYKIRRRGNLKIKRKYKKRIKDLKCCSYWDETQIKTFIITFAFLLLCAFLKSYLTNTNKDTNEEY